MEIKLTESPYDSEPVRDLVAEVQEEYVVRYGGRDATPTDAAEFAPPYGAFLVAMAEGEAIGCAGLRRHDERAVEIKRMFVRSAHRRKGLGRLLLRALEDRSRDLGYHKVILETGTAQPEAIALYVSEGYEPIPGFGHYRWSPQNRCFAKEL